MQEIATIINNNYINIHKDFKAEFSNSNVSADAFKINIDDFALPLYMLNDNENTTRCIATRINAALLLEPNDKLEIVENYFSEANLSKSIKNGDDPLKAGNGLSDNDKQALFLNTELMQKLPYYGDSPSKWLTSNLISEEQRKALCFYDKSETIPVETYTVGKLFGNQKMLLPFTIICKK